MDRVEAESRVREVQRIMERTTLYTLLPGWPAVIGGILALFGCAVTWALLKSLDFRDASAISREAQLGMWGMWTAIGIAGVALEIFWTRAATTRLGINPLARPARFAALALSPSVIVALVLTVRILQTGDYYWLAPVWTMCYGTGLYAAGLFSVRLPRLLGIAFIAAGAAGLLFFPQWGVALVALTFGAMHVAFGVVVIYRSRKADAA